MCPSRGVALLQENPQEQVGGRRDRAILLQNLKRAIEYDYARRKNVGALRLQTIATRDRPCADFPVKTGDDYDPAVLLDLDYWVLIPW